MKFDSIVDYIEEHGKEHYDELIKDNNARLNEAKSLSETFTSIRNIIQSTMKEKGIDPDTLVKEIHEDLRKYRASRDI